MGYDSICFVLGSITMDTLFAKVSSGPVVVSTESPIKKNDPISKVAHEKAIAKVTKLDTVIEKKVTGGEPVTKKQKPVVEKSGFLYDWFEAWTGHEKNGNIGLVPEPFRGQKIPTWEKFMESSEGKTLKHFESFVNVLLD